MARAAPSTRRFGEATRRSRVISRASILSSAAWASLSPASRTRASTDLRDSSFSRRVSASVSFAAPSAVRPTLEMPSDALSLTSKSKTNDSVLATPPLPSRRSGRDLLSGLGQRLHHPGPDVRPGVPARIGEEPRLHAAGLPVRPVPRLPRAAGVDGVADEPVIEQDDLPLVVAGLRADLDARVGAEAAGHPRGQVRGQHRGVPVRQVRPEVLHVADLPGQGFGGVGEGLHRLVAEALAFPACLAGAGGDPVQVSAPVWHGRPLSRILGCMWHAYLITEAALLAAALAVAF